MNWIVKLQLEFGEILRKLRELPLEYADFAVVDAVQRAKDEVSEAYFQAIQQEQRQIRPEGE